MLRSWLYSVGGLIGFLLVSYVVIHWGFPLVMPFLIAALLAQLMNPIVEYLSNEKRKFHLPRGFASAVVLLVIASIAALVLTLGIAQLVHEISHLVRQVPTYYDTLLNFANRLAEDLGQFSSTLPESAQTVLRDTLSALRDRALSALPNVASSLTTLTKLPSLFIDALVIMVATFFFSRDRRTIAAFLYRLVPPAARPKVSQVKNEVWENAVGFAKAQAILMTTTAVYTTLGLLLVGADYAVLMGVLVGVTEVIPVVGTALVYVPWLILQLLTGHYVLTIKLTILYMIGVIVRQILEPKLLAENTGLHPLSTLLSIYLGITIFGPWGFIIGPLLAIFMTASIRSGLLPIFQQNND